MKYSIIVFLLISLGIQLNAQEEYIFTQYFLNPATINPGASGFDGNHNILFNYRNTWSGFPDAPISFAAHYNGEVLSNVGIGAYLVSDQFAGLSSTRGSLSFAYMIKGESYKIGAGLSAQLQQYGLNNINLNSTLIDPTDENILMRLDNSSFFEANLGLHGELSNGMFFDLSFPGMVRASLSEEVSQEVSPATFNYFFGVGYPFGIANYDMEIEPSIYIKKFRNIPLHVDFNALFKFLDGKLISGVSISGGADNRVGFLIGTQINTLRFNYSYNISTHPSQQFNNGGHEIGIGLVFGSGQKDSSIPE